MVPLKENDGLSNKAFSNDELARWYSEKELSERFTFQKVFKKNKHALSIK